MPRLMKNAKKLPIINWNFTFFGAHLQKVDDNWKYPRERHTAFEMIYVLKGIEEINCSSYTYFLNPGDFAIITPGTYHQVMSKKDLTYFCFHFDLDEPSFEEHLISNAKLVYRENEKITHEITDYMDQMLSILSSKKTEFNFTNKMELQMVLSKIILKLYQYTNVFPSNESITTMQFAKIIRVHIKTMVHEQVSRAMSNSDTSQKVDIISTICHELNLSISYASKIFKSCYGTSPKSYLSSIKQGIAQQLLLKPQFDINQISFFLGYANPGNFSRQFKLWTGSTPKQFRIRKINHFVDQRLFSENFSTFTGENDKSYRDKFWDNI